MTAIVEAFSDYDGGNGDARKRFLSIESTLDDQTFEQYPRTAR